MQAEPNRGVRGTLNRRAAERVLLAALPLLLVSTDCGNTPPAATTPVEPAARAESVGMATYYARSLDGRMTASGIRFDQKAMVAAHPTLPFGTVVRVTNLQNGRSVNVRIVDRGPAAGARRSGVIIDLSRAAAESLDFIEAGRSRVSIEQLSSK